MTLLATWLPHEKPREKLLNQGAEALSDSELLAIFLRTGIKGKNVVELSRDILKHFGSLKALLSADLTTFCQFKGLGEAKYAQLQACLEMSHRYLTEELTHQDVIESPAKIKTYVQNRLIGKKNEVFAAVFLNNQHQIIRYEELFFGTINASTVHPRVIVQRCLALNAAAIIITHNHPSGNPRASKSDIDITSTLKQTLDLVDVRLLDHLIVASHQVISLAELNLIQK